jgi:hypothetical protein
MKIRALRVAAALRRDRGPDEAGPSSIFIRGGELEKVMRHSYENGLKGHKKIAQGTAGEKQEPSGDCHPRRPGSTILINQVSSSCWRGKAPHANTRRIVIGFIDPGRRRGQGPCSALGYSPSPTSWAGGPFHPRGRTKPSHGKF